MVPRTHIYINLMHLKIFNKFPLDVYFKVEFNKLKKLIFITVRPTS